MDGKTHSQVRPDPYSGKTDPAESAPSGEALGYTLYPGKTDDGPLRVLHVFGRLDRGGAESLVMTIYRNIDRSRVQFDFVEHTLDKCAFESEIDELGGRIFHAPEYTGRNHFQYRKFWTSFIEAHPEYQIIHSHVRSTAAIFLGIAKRHGLTAISHSHSTSSGSGLVAVAKSILQYPIRYVADYFFACSQNAGEWLFGKKVCSQDNFLVIKNAIDVNAFVFDERRRTQVRHDLGLEGKFVIGHVGNFTEAKNHQFLIDVFAEVVKRHPDSVLLLVGDGDSRGEAEKRARLLGIIDRIVFCGVREDVNELLWAMDIFAFPSLFEGLGIAVIEAQATGLRCVVSDTLPQEAIITGLVSPLPLGSASSWATEILKSVDGYERTSMLKAIRHSGYDAPDAVRQFVGSYSQMSHGSQSEKWQQVLAQYPKESAVMTQNDHSSVPKP